MSTVSHAVNGPPSERTASRHDPPPGMTRRRRSLAVSDAHLTLRPLTRPPSGPGSVTSSGSPQRAGGSQLDPVLLAARFRRI
ncbi:MAG: hypothetical protein ACRDOH_28860 [Streptosporangiaceae bacterium]